MVDWYEIVEGRFSITMPFWFVFIIRKVWNLTIKLSSHNELFQEFTSFQIFLRKQYRNARHWNRYWRRRNELLVRLSRSTKWQTRGGENYMYRIKSTFLYSLIKRTKLKHSCQNFRVGITFGIQYSACVLNMRFLTFPSV